MVTYVIELNGYRTDIEFPTLRQAEAFACNYHFEDNVDILEEENQG